MWGWVHLGIGAVAAGFLVYTLLHREALGIPLLHGRVLVEAALALGFGTLGIFLLTR